MLYLTSQSLVLLHHLLILLVYTQHLTDPVGSRLCLRAQSGEIIKKRKTFQVSAITLVAGEKSKFIYGIIKNSFTCSAPAKA